MSDLVRTGGILKNCPRDLNQNYKPKFNFNNLTCKILKKDTKVSKIIEF